MHHSVRITFVLSIVLTALVLSSPLLAQSRPAPPGIFKDLDDEILGGALIIHGKQLFIDDYVIGDMQGVRKQLKLLTATAQEAVPVSVGERQLFLDDHGIAKTDGLQRTMHQPKKRGAVIEPDQP